MSIIVCNLEVPTCWLEYGKASKSLREIIVFLRFLQHLNNHWDQLLCLFIYFCTTIRIVNWFHGNERGGVVALQT